jgi:hypothetical protein
MDLINVESRCGLCNMEQSIVTCFGLYALHHVWHVKHCHNS